MRSKVISASDLSPTLIQAWHALQDRSPDLASPFFCPEFTQAVARHRKDLRVTILQAGNDITGFLPFHRKMGGCGAPVGGQVSDYQGVIGAPDDPAAIPHLLRASGLAAYDFNHALAGNPIFAQNAYWRSRSPRADLRLGLDAWRADINGQTKALKTLERKRRKLARELGPLRFVVHDDCEPAWRDFLDWKNRALQQAGAAAFLGEPWLAKLIADLRVTQGDRFGGYFSTLYAGDRLVAAHFGIRSGRAWHWWFPTYDSTLRNHSPGLVLMLFCIEEAARVGLAELDFGRGTQRYKKEFGNRARELCEGSLELWHTPCGASRKMRKAAQRVANRYLPDKAADFIRRGATKVLRAGVI